MTQETNETNQFQGKKKKKKNLRGNIPRRIIFYIKQKFTIKNIEFIINLTMIIKHNFEILKLL